MEAKLLTENGWKTITGKYKVKDNGLQRALATYENIENDRHDERLKAINLVAQLAATLDKAKEIAALPDVTKYLAGVSAAAESEKSEIAKAKLIAARNAAIEQKKAREDKGQEQETDVDEEQGAYEEKLIAAFKKLKSSKDLAFQFIVCDAKPLGLMVAKKITPQHRAELIKLTGSKRVFPIGTCRFVEGKFHFVMEKPVAGLARRLQDSIKQSTGKKFSIVAGAESVEDDEGHTEAGAPVQAPASAKSNPAIGQAQVWHKTRKAIEKSIEQLKSAVRKDFANDETDLVDEVEQSLGQLDRILATLDRRLADSLVGAHSEKDPAARKAGLDHCRNLLKEYLTYVESEPLIAHIDSNPFGVKTNLKPTLVASLRRLGESVARA